MMQDFIFEEEQQKLSFTTIRSMVRVLNSELLKNPSLASDLLQFLKDRNIDIPDPIKMELNKQSAVSSETKKSTEQIYKLKRAFEGVNVTENIL